MIVSVQYLRALAAVLVLFWHVRLKSSQGGLDVFKSFTFAHAGVDIFFVISGFIMAYLYCKASKNKLSVGKFFVDRCVRILPLYWLLSIVAGAAFFIAPSHVNSSGGETGIWESFVLIPTGKKFLIQNGWTLTYEFCFYILFSTVFILKNKKLGLLLGIAIVGSSAIFGNSLFLAYVSWNFSILMEFCLGMAVCLFYILVPDTFIRRVFGGFLFIIGIGILIQLSDSDSYQGMDIVWCGGSAFSLVLGALCLEPVFAKLKNLTMIGLGNSSYSMYLLHPFILAFFGMAFKKIPLHKTFYFEVAFWLSVIIFVLIISHIFYRTIEIRSIRGARAVVDRIGRVINK